MPAHSLDLNGDAARAHRDVLRGWRLYVAEVPLDPTDAACVLLSLRCLEQCLQRLRIAQLDAAAGCVLPPAIPLGDAARRLVQWLRKHPKQAWQPVEWLVDAAIGAQPVRKHRRPAPWRTISATDSAPPGTPVRATDPGSRSSSA